MRDGNLRQLFRKHLPEVFWISVESGGTGRGIPDSHGIYRGCSVWIEFKSTAHYKVAISPEQIAWHLRYARNGGRSFIAVRRKGSARGVACDELWLIAGALVEECVSLGSGKAPFRADSGGPARWPWEAIKAFIFHS